MVLTSIVRRSTWGSLSEKGVVELGHKLSIGCEMDIGWYRYVSKFGITPIYSTVVTNKSGKYSDFWWSIRFFWDYMRPGIIEVFQVSYRIIQVSMGHKRGSAAFRKWLPNSVVRPLTIFATATARVWLSIGERTELGMLSPCFSVHQTVTRRFWGYEVTKTNSLLVHEVNSNGFQVTP